jgi:hypothetical protein
VSAIADNPHPRPAFLPSTPPEGKAISAYTASDVLGIISTDARQLPATHPFVLGKRFTAGIKADWPGASDATKIDALVQIILDAPETSKQREIEYGWDNVRYVLHNVMDVSDSAKADALVRVAETQTDATKKVRAVSFAASMFSEYLDPRLLGYRKVELDDATVVSVLRTEESGAVSFTRRKEARRIILADLQFRLEMNVDHTPFNVGDEAARCAALKAWLTANWANITAKCAEAKAKPDWKPQGAIVRTWDVQP